MQGVLRYGTASRHSFPAEAGGKTGTDEILDSGVFVAATATKTVAVWLEHGGPGGGRAAWVGSRLLRTAGE